MRASLLTAFAALPFLLACPPERPEVCVYGGQDYGLGDVFVADDGCSQCTCNEGPSISCSARTCGGEDGGGLDAGPPPDGAADDAASLDSAGDAGSISDAAAPELPIRPNEVVSYPAAACEVISVNGVAPAGPPAPGDAIVISAIALPPPTPGASVTQVDWSLVRTPPGSRSGLRSLRGFTTSLGRKSLSSAQLDRSRGPDLAGTYLLRAQLEDDQGGSAAYYCHLDVRPREALYLELSWDRQEVNLDLRLARRTTAGDYCAVGVLPQMLTGLAQPCAEIADVCYFGNCLATSNERPDWDGDLASDGPGDPLLHFDNWSGLGPEVVTIDEPTTGSFLVSAHHWSGDRSPVTARVTVWLRGELWGFAEQVLEQQQWWEPFLVHWDSGAQADLCVETAATSAQSCGAAPRCAPIGDCVACTDDLDCGPGSTCDAALQDCVAAASTCAGDQVCASGQRCIWSADVCIDPACSPAAPCADAEDLCDEHASLCVPAPVTCVESNEPNNSMATATPYTVGMNDLLCRGDLDYIRVAGHADAELHVYVALQTGSSETSNVRAALLDASGAVVDEAEVLRSTGLADLAVTPPADADYYVRVDGSAASAQQYDYTVSTAECLPEPGEPNDDLSQAGNAVLTEGSYPRTLCGQGDEDWYQLTAPANLRTRVLVSYDAQVFDVAVELLTVDGALVDDSSRGQGLESVRFSAGATEQILVARVLPGWWQGGAEVQSYGIEVVHEPIPDCNDGFEPNNIPVQAAPLGPGVHEANICDIDDEDHYAIALQTGGSLQATIQFSHSEGDIDVHLTDQNGKQLDSSTSTQDQEDVELASAGAAGPYYLRIYPFQGGTEPDRQVYTVTLTASGLADAGLVADASAGEDGGPVLDADGGPELDAGGSADAVSEDRGDGGAGPEG